MTSIVNRRTRSAARWAVGLGAGVVMAGAVGVIAGQLPTGMNRDWDDGIKYARGQNVVAVFEGWVPNADGTFGLVFGYFNRNWEESMFIPVGPDNKIEPGNIDQGQPTAFLPRRERLKFEITVPKDFGKKEVVWTLTNRGRTEKAYGALIPAEVLSRKMVLAGAGRDFSDDDTGDATSTNQAPVITADPVQPVTLPNKATISLAVTDDGVTPTGFAFGIGRGRNNRGIRLFWSTYRGPAMATFEPQSTNIPDLKGGKATITASFPVAGTYVLRGTAQDVGSYMTHKDITVVVK